MNKNGRRPVGVPDFSDSTAATIARRAQRALDKFGVTPPKSPFLTTTTTTQDKATAAAAAAQEEQDDDVPIAAARLTREEISTTVRIAQGGFCDIWGIKHIELITSIQGNHHHHPRPWTIHEQECRFALQAEEQDSSNSRTVVVEEEKHGTTHPQPCVAAATTKTTTKYVLKHVSKDHTSHLGMFLAAAIDLGREAHILQSIHHPHILQLRGTSLEGVQSYQSGRCHDSHFLIFDRLVETLDNRIDAWGAETKRHSASFWGGGGRSDRTRPSSFVVAGAERLQVCCDLASALEYLHERNIIHRDLKPTNLGFDGKGRIQLFDFGLAVQLPSSPLPHHNDNNTKNGQQDNDDDDDGNDDNYVVTHDDLETGIGSYRYMAPEIAKHQPYNLKADVFSFSVICHHVLSLTRPHGHIEEEDHDVLRDQLFKGNGRPTLNSKHMMPPLSSSNALLRQRLEDGWSWDMKVRPRMSELHKLLKDEHEDCVLLGQTKAPIAHQETHTTTTHGATFWWMTYVFVFLKMRWHELQLYLMSWMPKMVVHNK